MVGRDPSLLAALRPWLPTRRWFPAKDAVPGLRLATTIDLHVDDDAHAAIHLLRLVPTAGTAGAASTAAAAPLLQVPTVAYRALPAGHSGAEPGWIGPVAGPDPAGLDPAGTARWWLRDGCDDPVFLAAWLDAATWADGRPDLPGTDARLLSGEQSNTSVVLGAASDRPAILKVFRSVTPGANPDVEVPLGLARTGWDGVPAPLGWLTAPWPGLTAWCHLGVVSEFVPGADDGFELACATARRGASLARLARELGERTAQMHAALRQAFPTDGPGRVPELLTRLRERAEAVLAAVPVLHGRAGAVREVLADVSRLADHPALAATVQRVHGDYHLGQVLRAPRRGWLVLDFEGEPTAPLEERVRPDFALRDVAGMLRSFDYAAVVGGAGAGWLSAARAGMLEGYAGASGTRIGPADPVGARLLRALELDKALYEVHYELRSRPDWVHIPLGGVDRLLAR